ncbi:DNA-directed RNA polymerase [Candidatus Micrarchaeota archaeon]|nr:DNA-directed RNA polymerase [Candidatus Micrarchaeota archaeon]
MYKLVTFEESVRIPPNLFGMPLNKAALKILREQYERTVDKQLGIVISLHNAKIKSPGRVLQGDGAAYFDIECDALSFTPVINEVIDGKVSEIVEFGAFVRLGPIDGLVHVSQVANDFMTFDKKQGSLVGRDSKRVVRKGDKVRAKVATVSLKDNIPNSKIALTMRPEGLGKTAGKEEGEAAGRESRGSGGRKRRK